MDIRKYFYSLITHGPKDLFGGLIKLLLMPLSLLYYAIVMARHLLYRSRFLKQGVLGKPVISIGNLTWGGTGKTPLAEHICRYLVSKGKKTALLTRGYGMDEDKAFARKIRDVSVIAGSNRYANALSAQKQQLYDIFVLDDGFQHLRIKRDAEIVTINATDPFGNGWLIPAGILREPLSSLSRAHIAVITKSDLADKNRLGGLKTTLLKINPRMGIYTAIHKPVSIARSNGSLISCEYLRDKDICAVSALGDNRSFVSTLRNLGARIKKEFLYTDHYRYDKNTISDIVSYCKENSLNIITTEKDWIKIREVMRPSEGVEFFILNIRVKIDDEEGFFRRLSALLDS